MFTDHDALGAEAPEKNDWEFWTRSFQKGLKELPWRDVASLVGNDFPKP